MRHVLGQEHFLRGKVTMFGSRDDTMSAPITEEAHTHVGTPPPDYDGEWVTHTVHWHGFGTLSAEQDIYFDSPEFTLLGNQWRLELFPGGSRYAHLEGMVSLYLENNSNKAIDIHFGFSVNDGNGEQVAWERSATPNHFDSVGVSTKSGGGFHDFELRSKLMNSLVNGALVIEVHMKLATPTKSVPPPFIPENPVVKMIQGLFLDEKSADIVFEIGGEKRKTQTRKKAKTVPATFPAHRNIVENCSSIFAELCESNDDDKASPIQINDVTPDVFRLLLFYIYGGKVSDDDMKSHAKEIVNAADKFGVVNLKLEAEAFFVEATTFTIQNVMEHLLYADSKNLALLKEAAMDYMMENRDEVLEKISFTDVPGTLVRDVLAATARGEVRNVGTNVHVDNQYNALRISELRKMAHDKDLTVDGSREMLIAALKAAQESDSSEVDSEEDSEEMEPEED
jgi:hypothetical protein